MIAGACRGQTDLKAGDVSEQSVHLGAARWRRTGRPVGGGTMSRLFPLARWQSQPTVPAGHKIRRWLPYRPSAATRGVRQGKGLVYSHSHRYHYRNAKRDPPHQYSGGGLQVYRFGAGGRGRGDPHRRGRGLEPARIRQQSRARKQGYIGDSEGTMIPTPALI